MLIDWIPIREDLRPFDKCVNYGITTKNNLYYLVGLDKDKKRVATFLLGSSSFNYTFEALQGMLARNGEKK